MSNEPAKIRELKLLHSAGITRFEIEPVKVKNIELPQNYSERDITITVMKSLLPDYYSSDMNYSGLSTWGLRFNLRQAIGSSNVMLEYRVGFFDGNKQLSPEQFGIPTSGSKKDNVISRIDLEAKLLPYGEVTLGENGEILKASYEGIIKPSFLKREMWPFQVDRVLNAIARNTDIKSGLMKAVYTNRYPDKTTVQMPLRNPTSERVLLAAYAFRAFIDYLKEDMSYVDEAFVAMLNWKAIAFGTSAMKRVAKGHLPANVFRDLKKMQDVFLTTAQNALNRLPQRNYSLSDYLF